MCIGRPCVNGSCRLCLNVSFPKSHCHHIAPLRIFCMVAVVTAPQDLPYRSCSCSCRSVHHWDFKGADHNIFNLPMDPESMTDSHTLCCLFFISLACSFGGSAILCKCSEGRATKKRWETKSNKVHWSTKDISQKQRNIINKQKHTHHFKTSLGTFRTEVLRPLTFCCTVWLHSSSLGVWLHLFIYTKMDRGVDVLISGTWSRRKCGCCFFFFFLR